MGNCEYNKKFIYNISSNSLVASTSSLEDLHNMASSSQMITAAIHQRSTMKKRSLNGELVIDALRTIDDPNGSTITYLKTYIAAKYSRNVEEVIIFLSKYLKEAVGDGTLIQVPGKRFLSAFKLAPPNDVSVNPVEEEENSGAEEQKADEQTEVSTKRSPQQLDVEEQPESKMIRIESQETTNAIDKEKVTATVPFTVQAKSETKVGTKRSSHHFDVEDEREIKRAKTETELNSEAITHEKVVKQVRFTTSTKGIVDPDVIQQQQVSRNITFKVIEAVGILGKAGACSLRSIKKYLVENYGFTKNDISGINGVVKSAILSGVILGTNGTDLRGSFKLARDFSL